MGSRWRTPYWDWNARTAAGRILPAVRRHRADAPPLRAARRARHDQRRRAGSASGPATRRLARAVWAAVEALGQPAAPTSGLNIADPALALACGDDGAVQGPVRDGDPRMGPGKCRRDARAWPRHGRAGRRPARTTSCGLRHMGHVNAHMTLGALATMEAAMNGLGVAHCRRRAIGRCSRHSPCHWCRSRRQLNSERGGSAVRPAR